MAVLIDSTATAINRFSQRISQFLFDEIKIGSGLHRLPDPDYLRARLRACLPTQCRRFQLTAQKVTTLHSELPYERPRRRPIIRQRDDGAGRNECRVLCKNSNDDASQSLLGGAIVASIQGMKVQIFPGARSDHASIAFDVTRQEWWRVLRQPAGSVPQSRPLSRRSGKPRLRKTSTLAPVNIGD